jgi:hypothetical protein
MGGNSASPLNSTVPVLRLDRLAELRLGVRDSAVVGERVLAERIADALDSRLVLGGGELVGLEPRDRVLDRRPPLRRVEALPFGGGEDEVEDGALLRRELGFDQIGRPLGIRSRDLELVLQAPADRADQEDERDDDPHPGADDAPRMAGAQARPAREASCG